MQAPAMPTMPVPGRAFAGGPRGKQPQPSRASWTAKKLTPKGGYMRHPKRFLRPLSHPISKIGKPTIRRIARRGGVKRIDSRIYDFCRASMASFIRRVHYDAMVYCASARLKTVTDVHLLYALKRNGMTMYM